MRKWVPRFWEQELSLHEALDFDLELRWIWSALMFGWPSYGILIRAKAIRPRERLDP